MTLLTSDVPSIAKSLSYWEIAEYVSASLVAVGCIGEALAEFTNAFTGGVEARKERLRKCSTFLLIAALALEVVLTSPSFCTKVSERVYITTSSGKGANGSSQGAVGDRRAAICGANATGAGGL
jgi:hypothetical protein